LTDSWGGRRDTGHDRFNKKRLESIGKFEPDLNFKKKERQDLSRLKGFCRTKEEETGDRLRTDLPPRGIGVCSA